MSHLPRVLNQIMEQEQLEKHLDSKDRDAHVEKKEEARFRRSKNLINPGVITETYLPD